LRKRPLPTNGQPVKEFMVCPPDMLSFDQKTRERFVAHMARRFPDRTFTVLSGANVALRYEYLILPVMGSVGDGGELFDEPSQAFIAELYETADAFEAAPERERLAS